MKYEINVKLLILGLTASNFKNKPMKQAMLEINIEVQ